MSSILLVNDEYDTGLLLQTYLTGIGHHLHIAPEHQYAVQALAKSQFDVIIFDFKMLKQDEDELWQALHEKKAHTKVIYICGWDDLQVFTSWGDVHMDTIVPKPIRLVHLNKKINEMLRSTV